MILLIYGKEVSVMQDKQPMSEIIKETIDKVKNVADTKTVIGEPITLIDGVTIIPVSKVSVGAGIGGGEYGTKKNKKNTDAETTTTDNFGGGGGTGITVTPVAFLVITADGETKLLNIGENSGYASAAIMGAVNGIDAALDKAPDIIEKIKFLFKGKKSKESSSENSACDSQVTTVDYSEN